MEERSKEEDQKERLKIVSTRRRPPNDFHINIGDARTHGFTKGCGGCSSWFRGLGRRMHTEPCRKRFEGLMREEAKVVNAKRKKEE